MYEKFGNYINGEFRKSSTDTFITINPATEEVLGEVPNTTGEEVREAIEVGQHALKIWRLLTTWERSEKIQKIALFLKETKEQIAKAITLETGKPLAQSLREVDLSIDQFIWFSEATKRINGEIIPTRLPNTDSYVKYEPLGVCAGFSSWNFPFLLIARKMAPALAAGCPMITRSSEVSPLSAMYLHEACHKAGLPAGMVALLNGEPNVISENLMAHPAVRKVSLTGSMEVGQKFIRQSAETIKKVTMELGGNAPVIIYDDVDIDKVIQTIAPSKYANAGQVCVSPSRFYVQRKIFKEFSEKFAQYARDIKLGNGLEPTTQMGPLVHKRRLEAVESFVEQAKRDGATILAGGKRPSGFTKGFFYEPTVISDLSYTSMVTCQEVFGPVALMQVFDTFEEVIAEANKTEYGLASYVFTKSLDLANRTANSLEAGMVGVNTPALAAAEVPFGGIKSSGFGRESSDHAMFEYMHMKIITQNSTF